MLLLRKHIISQSRTASVKVLADWPRASLGDLDLIARMTILTSGFPPNSVEKYVLFDNGQDTYWDRGLWETLVKSIPGRRDLRVVLFCSFGSPTSQPLHYVGGTPLRLDSRARISLVPNEEQVDQYGSAGLLLTREEFNEVIERAWELALHKDIQDEIFTLTGGHAGAVADVLLVMTEQVSLMNLFLPPCRLLINRHVRQNAKERC
jgi:hypothetical protein